jgi:hypothetical protein
MENLNEAGDLKKKRERIEALVLGVLKRMDNAKMLNYNRYKAMFAAMSDEQFSKWASGIGKNLDDTITMTQLPYEEMKMTQIKDAADFLGIPLEEYVYFRHFGPKPIRTKIPVPVGYAPIRRVQQLLSKKNRYSFDNEDVGLKDGQVKGDSKVASFSDQEVYSLAAIGADKAIEELLGPRADSQAKKLEMYKDISRDGYVTLNDLEKNVGDDRDRSTTLNTLDVYMLASGIKSDLITSNNSLKTLYTTDQDLRNPPKK